MTTGDLHETPRAVVDAEAVAGVPGPDLYRRPRRERLDGHAFAVSRAVGVTGAEEVVVTSCTLDRTATLRPPLATPFWTARLVDPSAGTDREVRLDSDEHESFEQACRWVALGSL